MKSQPLQAMSYTSINKTIPIEPYQGKKFRCRISGKITPIQPSSFIRFSVKIRRLNGQNGFSKSIQLKPTASPGWQNQSLQGRIPEDGAFMGLIINMYRGGQFFIDDMLLEVETSPDNWEPIPGQNLNFENWDTRDSLIGWKSFFDKVNTYDFRPSTEDIKAGSYALEVYSTGPPCVDQATQTIVSTPFIEHLSTEDGLPNNIVKDIIKDRKGFIWLSTENGLVRYDGYDFKLFSHSQHDSSSLSDNYVFRLCVDSQDKIWVGTIGGGLNLFDPITETFTRFQHKKGDSLSLPSNLVIAIYEAPDQTIWVGLNGGGLSRFDRDNFSFHSYQKNHKDWTSPMGNQIWDILVASNDDLWVSVYANGIAKFNQEKNEFTHYQALDYPNGVVRYARKLMPAENGKIWWIDEKGLFLFDPTTGAFDSFPIEMSEDPNIQRNIFLSGSKDPYSGDLWMGGAKSIARFDPKTNTFEAIDHQQHLVHGFKSDQFWDVFSDEEGIQWIASGNGVQKLNPFISQFRQLPQSSHFPLQMDDRRIDFVFEGKDGRIWMVVAHEGLFSFDFTQGEFRHYDILPGGKENNQSANVTGIFETKDGRIWIGANRTDLGIFDPSTEKFEWRRSPTLRPRAFFEDNQGRMWIGGIRGLFVSDKQKQTFRSIPWKSPNLDLRQTTSVSAIFSENDTILWIGTTFGEIRRYHPEKEEFQEFTPDFSKKDLSFGSHAISCITRNTNGNIFAGTFGKGIWEIDVESKQSLLITESDGLASNSISDITEDLHGRLWVSTLRGLSHYDPINKEFKNYSKEDVLTSQEFLSASLSHFPGERKGSLYFGTNKGIIAFHPDSLIQNTFVPPVVISSLHRFNKEEGEDKPIPVPGISYKSSISLSYKDELLIFRFAALSYAQSAKNEYAYKMEGLHDEWIQLGRRREVSFPHLQDGDYVLHVRASNGNGVWNETSTQLKIRINPPWWRSMAAKIIYVLLILGFFYRIYRFQLSRKLASAEAHRLRELDTVKSKIYTNITHEFRTPLTVIMGMADEIEKDIPKKLILRNSQNLLNLVNQMLDLSKLESGSMKLNMVQGDIIAYLNYLIESFHSLAESKNIRLDFDSELGSFEMDYDPQSMLQIVSNLISNAIKFTPESGRVSIGAQKEPEAGLTLKIADTGIGIARERLPHIFKRFYQVEDSHTRKGEGTGIGLTLTHELVKLLGGSIRVSSEVGKGTEFVVQLPISNEAPRLDPVADPDLFPPTPSAEAITSLARGQAVTEKPLVLIIEDNADVAAYLASCLKIGYQLEVASNGREGIEKALELTPDIIITDVMMPEKDGFEVTHFLKNDERSSHIPIVMLTAKADVVSKIEGLERGADAYLAKPFNKEELLVRLRKLLELRSKLQQYYLNFSGQISETVAPDTTLPENTLDHDFVQKVQEYVQNHLNDPDLRVDMICSEIGMSHSQLHRKLSALTGYSTNRFIRFIRLNKAQVLLDSSEKTISEIAYETGFNDPDYFSRIFKKDLGKTPSEFREAGASGRSK